jgi:WD40 repeat protein
VGWPGLACRTIAFSPDGHALLCVCEDRTARVWDAATGRETAVLRGHSEAVSTAAFSPDGRRVVTASEDGTVRLWHVEVPADAYALRLHGGHGEEGTTIPGPVHSVAFSPDGSRLVTTGDESAARVWDAATGQPVAVLQGLSDFADRKRMREEILGHARTAQFTPDGRRVLVLTEMRKTTLSTGPGDEPKEVPYTPTRLFDAATGAEVTGYRGDECQVNHAMFSADGRYVLTVEDQSRRSRHYKAFGSGESSESGDMATVARLYDTASGKELAVLKEPPLQVPEYIGQLEPGQKMRDVEMCIMAAALSPDGRLAATVAEARGRQERTLRLWDVKTGRSLRRLSADQHPLRNVVLWSPEGGRLLTCSDDGTQPCLWDVESGKRVAEPEVIFGPKFRSYAIGDRLLFAGPFSPDGGRLVGTWSDHTIRVIDSHTGNLIAVGKGHSRPVRAVSFSADGTRIVSASEDETARAWDAATGQELMTLTGHRGTVLDAAFSPDGKRVATASADGTARVWTLDLLPVAVTRKPRELTDAERQRFEIREPEGK